MENFSYIAVDVAGKEKKGSIGADTREDAVKQIKDMELLPVSISKQNLLNQDIHFSFGKKKVKTRDLSVFCRQFSSILRAGVNVINALEMLREQTENQTLREAIQNVQSDVEKGEPLSESMEKEPDVFPNLLVKMIAAGEASGSLDIAIERMAVQFEKDHKLKGLIQKAMMYPIVLCVVAIGVVIVMMAFVIPNFMETFDNLGAELPIYTKIVIAMSKFVQNQWWLMLIIVAAVFAGYKAYVRTSAGRHMVDRLKLKVPIFGKLAVKTACARFSSVMSTLITAGMPMMSALEIAAGTVENVIYQDALIKVRNGVSLGHQLSQQLRGTGLFPPMIVHMAGIGEETGNLEEMLDNASKYYDEEVEVTTQQVTALMEPMIILVMAGVVGGLIMAIYGPIMKLYQLL